MRMEDPMTCGCKQRECVTGQCSVHLHLYLQVARFSLRHKMITLVLAKEVKAVQKCV